MPRCALLVAIVVLAQMPAAAQSPSRTPWGDPDLQGTWDFTTITPLQRPPELAGKAFLTESEARALEQQINDQRVRTEEISPGSLGGVPRAETDPGIYNLSWWWEPNGRRLVGTRRTALVVDPPDGRIPALTPQAEAISRARDDARALRRTPRDLPLAERCIMGFNAGPPIVPGPYNNLVQIFQSPGYVVIVTEMVHDARIVPLDGRAPLGEAFRFWSGDARGRWEGDTLVVETRNLTDHGTGTFGVPGLTDRHARLIERFTRTGDRGLVYRFTLTDPTVWTRSWGAEVPMTRIDGFVMEYACHEGNYAMPNILAGARAEENVK